MVRSRRGICCLRREQGTLRIIRYCIVPRQERLSSVLTPVLENSPRPNQSQRLLPSHQQLRAPTCHSCCRRRSLLWLLQPRRLRPASSALSPPRLPRLRRHHPPCPRAADASGPLNDNALTVGDSTGRRRLRIWRPWDSNEARSTQRCARFLQPGPGCRSTFLTVR